MGVNVGEVSKYEVLLALWAMGRNIDFIQEILNVVS